MRGGRVRQREALADPYVELAGGPRPEHLSTTPAGLLARARVVHQRGPGDVQRAGRVEPLQVEGGHLPGGPAEEHERAAHAQHLERGVEGVLPHAVVHGVRALAVGQLRHRGGEVRIVHRGDGARAPGQLPLLLRGRRGDHAGAAGRRELGEQEPHPAGTGRHDHRVALLHREGGPAEVVGRHALQRKGGGLGQVDALRDGEETIRGGGEVLGVRTGGRRGGDTGPQERGVHALAERDDLAGALRAGGEGQVHRVDPGALVRLDEVQARRGGAHQHVPRRGGGHLRLGPLQDLGAARGGHDDGVVGAGDGGGVRSGHGPTLGAGRAIRPGPGDPRRRIDIRCSAYLR